MGHDHTVRNVAIALAVVVVVGAIGAFAILRLYRRPRYQRVLQFSLRRRTRVAKALRRGRPVAAEDMPVADALARTMRAQRWLPYLYGILPVIYLVNGLTHHGFVRWSGYGLAILYLVLAPWIIWQRRRTLDNWDRIAPATQSVNGG